MDVKNTWAIVKNRYRLSTKVQMSFELSFPNYLIGKCWCTIDNSYEIKTKKVSLSQKGIVLSDTIPLSWFTSSIFIPWTNVMKIAISDTRSSIDGILNTHLSSHSNNKTSKLEYCTLQLNDPQEMTISIPWSKIFSDYIKSNKLFDI